MLVASQNIWPCYACSRLRDLLRGNQRVSAPRLLCKALLVEFQQLQGGWGTVCTVSTQSSWCLGTLPWRRRMFCFCFFLRCLFWLRSCTKICTISYSIHRTNCHEVDAFNRNTEQEPTYQNLVPYKHGSYAVNCTQPHPTYLTFAS